MAVRRRDFLTAVGAMIPAMAVRGSRFGGSGFEGSVVRGSRFAAAQSATPARLFRIDTHAHFTIPKMYDLATAHGVQQATLKDWSPAKMLAEMEEGGVATSIISISDPGVNFGDNAAARTLARECNEAGAKVVRDYPGRFGLFAVLPLPDVDGALKEMEYALDMLKADGIGVLSSYDGKYLGNPLYTPLLEEMNRRQGVIYCHPYCAACGVQQTLTDAQIRAACDEARRAGKRTWVHAHSISAARAATHLRRDADKPR